MSRRNEITAPEYRMDQWMTLRMQLLWAYERTLQPTSEPKEGDFGFQSALYVRKGWIRAGDSRGRLLRAERGSWLILKQGKRWQHIGEDCELLSIGFRFQLPSGEPVYDQGLPLNLVASMWPQLLIRARAVMRAMDKRIGLGYFPRERVVALRDYLGVQNVFRDFLVELSEVLAASGCSPRGLNEKHPHVASALAEMDQIPSGARWNAQHLADQVGLSLSHLNRLMAAHTGTTIHEQMNRRRLAIAEESLQSKSSSLKAISYQLGFSSPSHFSSWFKKHRGVSPGVFSGW